MDNGARELADRVEIFDLVSRYCRAVDRADYAAVRAVYADDGVDHHTGFSGDADGYVAWLKQRTAQFSGTMHVLGTHIVEIDGDTAVSETYGTAHHWGEPVDDPALNFTSGVRYLDRLRREPEGWRIAERFAVREWTRSDGGRMRRPEGEGHRGVRGAEDPLYVNGLAHRFPQSISPVHEQGQADFGAELSTQDHVEIAQLKARYFRFVDTHDWQSLREVFTPDARFSGFGFGIRDGVDSLIDGLAAHLGEVGSQHRGFNPELRAVTAQRARGIWAMQDSLRWEAGTTALSNEAVPGMRGIEGTGFYEDEYVRTAAGWRISASRLVRTRVEALGESALHTMQSSGRGLDPRWLERT